MPRWIARLIPASIIIFSLYGIYLFFKMLLNDYEHLVVERNDRTRFIFVLIVVLALVIIMFSFAFEGSV